MHTVAAHVHYRIGSQDYHEGFTIDYDLPTDTAYAETCAAIGLVFFAQRMLALAPKAEYADVMERALYNGVLSGMSMEGTKFFYVNPLAVDPKVCAARHDLRHVNPVRQEWFGCACCPPNIARLLASIHSYIYSAGGAELFIHLYAGSTATIQLSSGQVEVVQKTEYPWDGTVQFTLNMQRPQEFSLNLRIPGWCTQHRVKVGDEELSSLEVHDGYLRLKRVWAPGDTVTLTLFMPVERVWANPQVEENVGKVALQRGPIVYCFEEVDNGPRLAALFIPRESEFQVEEDPSLGLPVLVGTGLRRQGTESLYTTTGPQDEAVPVTAVPYRGTIGSREKCECGSMNNKRREPRFTLRKRRLKLARGERYVLSSMFWGIEVGLTLKVCYRLTLGVTLRTRSRCPHR